jgi:hypothetical protein
MRDNHTLLSFSAEGEYATDTATLDRGNSGLTQPSGTELFKSNTNSLNEHKVYSTRSKYVATLENLQKSADYVREQQKVLNEIIQQFQLLSGYLEQTDSTKGVNTHAWSVYLMHAQAVQNYMRQTFLGKPLFEQDHDVPLRIYAPVDGEMKSYDLPLPSLRSIIPLGAFLHGTLDRSMPSIGLLEDCMAAVTSCLLEVQGARIFISDATRECRILRDKTQMHTTLPASSPVVPVERDNSLADVAPPKPKTTWLHRFFSAKIKAI